MVYKDTTESEMQEKKTKSSSVTCVGAFRIALTQIAH